MAQLTFEQYTFELCGFTYLWILFCKYTGALHILRIYIHEFKQGWTGNFVFNLYWESSDTEGQLYALFCAILY